jgi:hypothetical protein
MEELLTRYGKMPQELLERPLQGFDKLNELAQQDIIQTVIHFRQNEYKELERIFNLPIANSPNGKELWDAYFLKGKTHLIEMRLLKKQATLCRQVWSSYFKKKKVKDEEANDNANEENANGVSVRSEEAGATSNNS